MWRVPTSTGQVLLFSFSGQSNQNWVSLCQISSFHQSWKALMRKEGWKTKGCIYSSKEAWLKKKEEENLIFEGKYLSDSRFWGQSSFSAEQFALPRFFLFKFSLCLILGRLVPCDSVSLLCLVPGGLLRMLLTLYLLSPRCWFFFFFFKSDTSKEKAPFEDLWFGIGSLLLKVFYICLIFYYFPSLAFYLVMAFLTYHFTCCRVLRHSWVVCFSLSSFSFLFSLLCHLLASLFPFLLSSSFISFFTPSHPLSPVHLYHFILTECLLCTSEIIEKQTLSCRWNDIVQRSQQYNCKIQGIHAHLCTHTPHI